MHVALWVPECIIALSDAATRPANDVVPFIVYYNIEGSPPVFPDLRYSIERGSRYAVRLTATVSDRTGIQHCLEPVGPRATISSDNCVPIFTQRSKPCCHGYLRLQTF